MSILLATAHKLITGPIRSELIDHGLSVIEEEVWHRNYLHEVIEMTSPSMVIIHDSFLPSDCVTEEERDQEILQLIEHWRSIYDNSLRIVYLCVRNRHDPFLARLVQLNVWDIFHEKNLKTSQFVQQIMEPPRFKNVQKYINGNLPIEYMEESEGEENEDNVDVEDESIDSEGSEQKSSVLQKATQFGKSLVEEAKRGADTIKEIRTQKKEKEYVEKPIKPPKEKTEKEKKEIEQKKASSNEEISLKDFLDLMPVEITEIERPAIIGTVLIAVAGVKSHLGSTHAALSIASYLTNGGFSVAVVECNYSEDFDRIHSLYEGEKIKLTDSNTFELFNISHYKFRETLDLNHLYSSYEYVILDYGVLEHAAAFESEFKRAHIQCVVCSGDEWKFHWIDEFLKRNGVRKENCTFLVPGASKEKLHDLRKRLSYTEILHLPTQDSPYDLEKESEEIIRDLLGPFFKSSSSKYRSKSALVITSILSIAATALLLTIFKFLR